MVTNPETELAEFSDGVARLRELLKRQTRLLDLVISIILRSKDYSPPDHIKGSFSRETSEILPIMIQGAGSSCHTLYILSKNIELQVRDCFPIGRSIIEGIVNVCFILALGDVAAKRAKEHALQKSFRDMDREVRSPHGALKLELKGRPDIASVAGLQEALEKWTSKRGRERSAWTDESVEERINVVGEKFGSDVARDLMIANFSIYRHASEIVHGTYFGSLFFFGATHGVAGRNAIASHLMGILFAAIQANSALIKVAGKAYGADDLLGPASDEIWDELSEIAIFKK